MKTFFGVLLVLAIGLIGIPVLVVDVFGFTGPTDGPRIDVIRENGVECSRPAGAGWTCYRIGKDGEK